LLDINFLENLFSFALPVAAWVDWEG